MAVDIHVWCRCFERGLCKPCPIDASRLIMEDDDGRGHPWLADGYTANDLRTLQHWSETACAHRNGYALSERLCSSRMVPVLIERLQTARPGACPVLLRYLDAVSSRGADGTENEDAPVILREIEALYATGFFEGLTETGPDTIAGMMEILHRAAKAATEQGTNIVWS